MCLSPNVGVLGICSHARLFTWVLEVLTQILLLTQQVPLPTASFPHYAKDLKKNIYFYSCVYVCTHDVWRSVHATM